MYYCRHRRLVVNQGHVLAVEVKSSPAIEGIGEYTLVAHKDFGLRQEAKGRS